MNHDVFISHSSCDKAVADAVCATLEGRKIRCWIAPRDVPPGANWAGALIGAIGRSRIFVLVLSHGSNRSDQVLRELGEAVDCGIPIIPLRIEDVEPSGGMRYYIKSIHWLDALTEPLESHLEKLAASVQALLAVEVEEAPSVDAPSGTLEAASAPPATPATIPISAPSVQFPPAASPCETRRPVPAHEASTTVPLAAASGSTQRADIASPDMVFVPAGEFIMSSVRLGAKHPDQPHKVHLDDFWIGRHPVTNREYQIYVKGSGCDAPPGWKADTYPAGKENHPVVRVSWYDAVAYCRWLSGETGTDYRLPTEEEWEKAAS